jgi:hypothetical protein
MRSHGEWASGGLKGILGITGDSEPLFYFLVIGFEVFVADRPIFPIPIL